MVLCLCKALLVGFSDGRSEAKAFFAIFRRYFNVFVPDCSCLFVGSCALNVASKMIGLMCSLILPLLILLPIIEQTKFGFK